MVPQPASRLLAVVHRGPVLKVRVVPDRPEAVRRTDSVQPGGESIRVAARSRRSGGGGLRLARPAGKIILGEVVRATEDGFSLVECFDRANNNCVVAPACGLRGPLEEALLAFLAVLDSYSLADLVARPGTLRRMRQLLADQAEAG